MSRTSVAALTSLISGSLPECCRDCVFWQTLRRGTDAPRKRAWSQQFEDEHGTWGRALFDGDAFLGLLQYGPAAAFPRARSLPSGPPRADGALLTCAYLAPDEPAATLERLVLEALADLKTRGYASVDAFAIGGLEGPGGRHTLLHRPSLEHLGFARVRSRGPVALMRIELRGLQETSEAVRDAVLGGVPAAA